MIDVGGFLGEDEEPREGDLFFFYVSEEKENYHQYLPRDIQGKLLHADDNQRRGVKMCTGMPLVYIASSRNHVVVCHIFYSLAHGVNIMCQPKFLTKNP